MFARQMAAQLGCSNQLTPSGPTVSQQSRQLRGRRAARQTQQIAQDLRSAVEAVGVLLMVCDKQAG
ncbi:Uncharacterised protein [Klebsiella pneumoniae]|uniref:Uncharacterized protein n=1 Tax=Klebsiella pneumoniae TaxID=573 RepID=A0A2X3HF31_KLEPN|nr:Uncharacterised protein [Klebsiella pneumoniae]